MPSLRRPERSKEGQEGRAYRRGQVEREGAGEEEATIAGEHCSEEGEEARAPEDEEAAAGACHGEHREGSQQTMAHCRLVRTAANRMPLQ